MRRRLDSYITPEVLNSLDPRGRYDAANSAIFLRQLTEIITQTYDVQYPELKARKLIPADTRFNNGAEAFVWRQYNKVGQSKLVNSYANDFPNVEVQGLEFPGAFKSIGASYQFTVQDMRAAAMAGVPLDEKKAEAAKFAIETQLESICAIGDPAWNSVMGTGNGGFVSNADSMSAIKGGVFTNFPTSSGTAPTVPGAGTWQTLLTTPATAAGLILNDVNFMQQAIFYATQGVWAPDTLVLPTYHYGAISTTARSPVYTEDSILQFILSQSPWLKSIEFWPYLNTAGAGGVPRVAMYKKDPKVLSLNISQEFEQFPPQIVNMAWKVPCHMRVGAVTVRYPKAVMFLDGC